MFKADDYRLKTKALEGSLAETAEALDIAEQGARLAELKAEQEKPEVWQDLERSAKLAREAAAVEGKLNAYEKSKKAIEEVYALIDLIEEMGGGEEEADAALSGEIEELDRLIRDAESDLEDMRIRALLRGKYDGYNALLTLHSGAGGTESCDWVSMLYRMYTRYAERSGFKVTELDRLDGDEAGIKSVDFKIEGENAYGYLKAEKGVHRLVRISPFDANKRRHTSFASLEVMPEIEDDGDVEIRSEDLKVTTFRSSGAGGQHINKTESAIRIQHIPTGIVVSCQNERSQIQNREMAMKMLRSKLIELKESERLANEQNIKGEIKKIEWGSQIRSYVFCPYTLVKDHRTGFETGNIQAVMDGDIQPFIIDYLKKS
ncbi:MAG TPA: peptide chain release factor 2 [Candidatus Borkfalkia faecavium]|mgnify:FL=1|uniref:Peptide chain release factor 2 n=1 Tax=Candidatus Borkfalkia faecavium TaxID=2838508 RepID=A0A9D2AUA8_9FIRM|nr:peptide chain release factor 2 [Candidatus Borkfalkia faecavium]